MHMKYNNFMSSFFSCLNSYQLYLERDILKIITLYLYFHFYFYEYHYFYHYFYVLNLKLF